jgi:hypothetical protein
MKRQTLPWVLGMLLVGSAGSFGCDDGDSPKPDAGASGGAGGAHSDAAAGGTGGTAAGGTGGAHTDAAAGGTGGGAAGGTGGGAAGGTGGTDADSGAGGTGGTTDAGDDAVSDMAAPTDTAPDTVVSQPDVAAGSTVAASVCADIHCVDFFAITNSCSNNDVDTCHSTTSGQTTNACYDNGIKRQLTSMDVTTPVAGHLTIVKITKTDGVTPCYTVEHFTDDADPNSVEQWTYKTPAGVVFGTGGYRDNATANEKTWITCGGVRYNLVSGLGCSGTEGEPNCADKTTACAPPP